jgi:concanavalin A-like lectin/glucanase superfamily protein
MRQSRWLLGLLVAVILVLILAEGAAAALCINPPSGMVLWLTGDNTTTDLSGFGNSGAWQPSAAAAAFSAGEVDQAFDFTGSNSVRVNDAPSLDFGGGSMSIDAWVKLKTGLNQGGFIVNKIEPLPGNTGYGFFIKNQVLQFQFGNAVTFVSNPLPFIVGQWHHVAVTLDRTSATPSLRFYLDGAPAATFSQPSAISLTNAVDLVVGQPFASTLADLAIDELEIFNRALAASEVQSIFGAGSAGKCKCVTPPSGMVSWWPFDDVGGATSLADIIGGNNATPFASPVGAAQGPQPVAGIVGGALNFPKFGSSGLSGARVSPQGALANVGSANFTIDGWVQVPPAAANRLHYIVNKFDSGQNRGYALYVVSPGVPGNERLEFKWGDGANVATVQTIAPMTTGQFHHVAVTFARSASAPTLDIRLYVDGVQAGQQTGSPPGLGSLVNFVFLEVGWQPSTLDEPITIDELEIFNVALGAADIQAIYGAGSAGKCKCTTGGQSIDLTVASTGAVFGVGSGTPATVNSPLTINYSVQGCFGFEMFLIAVVNAPPIVMPPSYYNGSTWVPVPTPLSLITPFLTGGPATSNGPHTLFNGPLPPGTYDLYLACDLFVNGHLDVTFPPLCLSGAFDRLPLTVQ